MGGDCHCTALHRCVQQCMRGCTRAHKRVRLNLPCKNTLVGCASGWRGGDPRAADRSWHAVNCFNDGREVVGGGGGRGGADHMPAGRVNAQGFRWKRRCEFNPRIKSDGFKCCASPFVLGVTRGCSGKLGEGGAAAR